MQIISVNNAERIIKIGQLHSLININYTVGQLLRKLQQKVIGVLLIIPHRVMPSINL